ncbi:hypothetical protein AB0I87_33065 [Streptomyces sp. NPDC049952]|nr:MULTISPECIES: hypothetical protein [unclassified Streptomyces]MDX2624929.1 hypothetical protein [Streptomyces sp. WI03-5b]MEE1774817.1 hypothetical protein [Streptomyces sp. JV181]MYT58594.1 hypothetical protein [Streptomyces sp. SID7834]WJY35493.1 hypothetical protein QTO28_32670 [Streptomyces sp. P9-2B-1]
MVVAVFQRIEAFGVVLDNSFSRVVEFAGDAVQGGVVFVVDRTGFGTAP